MMACLVMVASQVLHLPSVLCAYVIRPSPTQRPSCLLAYNLLCSTAWQGWCWGRASYGAALPNHEAGQNTRARVRCRATHRIVFASAAPAMHAATHVLSGPQWRLNWLGHWTIPRVAPFHHALVLHHVQSHVSLVSPLFCHSVGAGTPQLVPLGHCGHHYSWSCTAGMLLLVVMFVFPITIMTTDYQQQQKETDRPSCSLISAHSPQSHTQTHTGPRGAKV